MPDAAHGNLATLSSLGTQEAIVCGDGVPLPMRIRFDDLPRARRPRSEGADFAKAWQTDSADAASETRGCAVGASKAANASPSSDIPILLAAGNPNMDRQRYCRGRRAGDPQSGHTPPRSRGRPGSISTAGLSRTGFLPVSRLTGASTVKIARSGGEFTQCGLRDIRGGQSPRALRPRSPRPGSRR
jgi:hypothetical protein